MNIAHNYRYSLMDCDSNVRRGIHLLSNSFCRRHHRPSAFTNSQYPYLVSSCFSGPTKIRGWISGLPLGLVQGAKPGLEGHDLPLPRPIAQHRTNPDFADGIWALVDVDVSRFDGRAEKINITVPRRMLAKIDSYAKAHGATRSGFLVEAARRVMEGRK